MTRESNTRRTLQEFGKKNYFPRLNFIHYEQYACAKKAVEI